MHTKTIIIGANNSPEPTKKPIQFKKVLGVGSSDYVVGDSCLKPIAYRYVELICKDYTYEFSDASDLMFAYDDPNCRHKGILFMGKWNDGVV